MAGRDSEIAGTAGSAVSPVVQAADPPLAAGSVIDGRYRVLAELGAGGMGRVYEAEHMFLRRRMALKLLRRGPRASAEAAARLVQEATLAGQVPHPAIVRVFDCAVLADGQVYLAMELLRGESLEAALRRPVQAAEIVSLLAEVARGLAAVHGVGVVHRDIKPANIFLARGESGVQAKLLDFGVAKLLGAADEGVQTQAGAVLGTPHYLAPEQARGGAIDGRADLYALGVILYEALTGSLPFGGDSFMTIVARQLHESPLDPRQAAPARAIPDGVARLTMRLLAKAPEDRVADANALAEQLGGLLEVEGPALVGLVCGSVRREGLAEGTGAVRVEGGAEAGTQVLVEAGLAEGTGAERATQVLGEGAGAERVTHVLGEGAGAERVTHVLGQGTGAERATQVLGEGAGAGPVIPGVSEGTGAGPVLRGMSEGTGAVSPGEAEGAWAGRSRAGGGVRARGPWFVGAAVAAVASAALGWLVVRAASHTEGVDRAAPSPVAPAPVGPPIAAPAVTAPPPQIGASEAPAPVSEPRAPAKAVEPAKARPGKKRPRNGGTTAAPRPPIAGADPPLKPDVYDE